MSMDSSSQGKGHDEWPMLYVIISIQDLTQIKFQINDMGTKVTLVSILVV